MHADAGRLRTAVTFGKKIRQRHGHEVGIGQIAVPVEKRFLGGLDKNMIVVGAAFSQSGDIKVLKDVQNLKGGHSLTVGRKIAGLIAAVLHADGLHPFGPVRGKVLTRDQRAVCFQFRSHGRRNISGIKDPGAAFRHGFERGGKIRLTQNVACAQWHAVLHENAGEFGKTLKVSLHIIRR